MQMICSISVQQIPDPMPAQPNASSLPVPPGMVERRIHTIRNQRVLLDSDLADLYHVETSNLNKAVKRNLARFPEDFMFQLNREEWNSLLFQFGIANDRRGGRRTPPYVFTEQGIAMLSSVLNSDRAVQVNIVIMRPFVKLREIVGAHKELAQKIDDLQQKYEQHDEELKAVFDAIRQLVQPASRPPKKKIGFHTEADPQSENLEKT